MCDITQRVVVISYRLLGTTYRSHLHGSMPILILNEPCLFAIYGIADSKFVITVALQNDICPYNRTYPMNAVVIVRNRITFPTDHARTS